MNLINIIKVLFIFIFVDQATLDIVNNNNNILQKQN
jgi:hypothetical protein